MHPSEHLETAIRSLRDPIEKFLQDGLWGNNNNNWNRDKLVLGYTQVRSTGREIARLHKRPFIRYEEVYGTDALGFRTLGRVNLFVPKQKRLVGHVGPILLANLNITGTTIWECRGVHVDLWKKILHHWLTDPELRAARNAPPL